jgi:hypothetical protein
MDLNENYGHNFRSPSAFIVGGILRGLGITQWAKDKKLTKEA